MKETDRCKAGCGNSAQCSLKQQFECIKKKKMKERLISTNSSLVSQT